MRALVMTILFVLVPVDASANVDVKPAPYEAQVTLRGKKVLSPHKSNPVQPAKSSPNPVTNPIKRPPVVCKVDPAAGTYGCRTTPRRAPTEEADAPELTEGDIARAVQRIGLPSLQVRIQPGDETLVNIPTIFYTEPRPFARSVDLLGFDIDLRAQPVRYQWVHGDGTVRSTSRPGRPYPAMEVTHRYRRPAEDVDARVDVTYRVRYRVDGGGWQTLGQTLLAAGPVAELDVKEAAPVLTKP
ncbi:MAG: hypothetical protein JWQ91_439 [Aeromicrobium sp.]|nr:hypothetical protein [Aeromicrobium sp.]